MRNKDDYKKRVKSKITNKKTTALEIDVFNEDADGIGGAVYSVLFSLYKENNKTTKIPYSYRGTLQD